MCAWIVLNEDIPEVELAAERLLAMDWNMHFYHAPEAPIIIITFSDAATGVCGSCVVRGNLDSEPEDEFSDGESDEGSD
jgi:hypothetical protein